MVGDVVKRKRPSIREDGSVSASDLSAFLDITPRRLGQLVEEGHAVRSGRGRYDFFETIHKYTSFLRDGPTKYRSNDIREQLDEARRAEIEQRMAIRDRDLIPMDDAMAAFEVFSGLILQFVSGLPAQISREVGDRKRIEKICDAGRASLAAKAAEVAASIRAGGVDIDAEEEDGAG